MCFLFSVAALLLSCLFSFLLYYWNFPDESKVPNWDGLDSAQYTINDVPVSREWWLSVQVARVIRFWAGFMMLSLGWLVFWHGLPSSAGTGFAWFLGIVSAGLSMLQYLPQIYRTYQNRVIAAFVREWHCC